MRRKRSKAGFSLAETLLAVLILTLVSIIVAQGVPVARNVYYKVVLGANAQVLLSTTVQALRDELGTAQEVTVVEETNAGKTVTNILYRSADTGAWSKIYFGKDSQNNDAIMLQEYVDSPTLSALGINLVQDTTGIGRRLVSTGTTTSDLYVKYDSVSSENGIVTINNLAVYRAGSEMQLAWVKSEEPDAEDGQVKIRVFLSETENENGLVLG